MDDFNCVYQVLYDQTVTDGVSGRPRQHGEDVDQVAEEELPGLMHGVAAKRTAVEDTHVGAG